MWQQLVKCFHRRGANPGCDCLLQLQQERVDGFVDGSVVVAQSDGHTRHNTEKPGARARKSSLLMQETATPISMFFCFSCKTLSVRLF